MAKPDPTTEFIYVAHPEADPEGRSNVVRAALECEGGMAERGWYEVDPPDPLEEAAAEFADLKKDALVAEAEARGLDTSGTKDELIERLASS